MLKYTKSANHNYNCETDIIMSVFSENQLRCAEELVEFVEGGWSGCQKVKEVTVEELRKKPKFPCVVRNVKILSYKRQIDDRVSCNFRD